MKTSRILLTPSSGICRWHIDLTRRGLWWAGIWLYFMWFNVSALNGCFVHLGAVDLSPFHWNGFGIAVGCWKIGASGNVKVCWFSMPNLMILSALFHVSVGWWSMVNIDSDVISEDVDCVPSDVALVVLDWLLLLLEAARMSGGDPVLGRWNWRPLFEVWSNWWERFLWNEVWCFISAGFFGAIG